MAEGGAKTGTIETRIPSRLDRLPWSRFHWLIVIGLGTVWILDGLEVTIVGSVASRLTEAGSGISITSGQIGIAAAFYVAGACSGALFFGQLTDRFGRKKLFIITLGVYIAATAATAFAFAPWYFFAARFFTGAGIGGEYAAINSAIDELIPARVRGRVDLIINGSYWLGSAAGAAAALVFLDTAIFSADLGWRLAFGLGVVLGFTILIVRRNVPESPRWLFIHGKEEEAEEIVSGVEEEVREETGEELPEPESSIKVRQREAIPFREIARTAFKLYPSRAVLGLALFVGQAFIYNGVTFNLGTLFTTFYGISSATVPIFVVVFALGNFLGPLTLGRLFDTVGRKPMIAGTYLGSAAVTVVMAILFVGGSLTSISLEAFIVVTFFLASAGASAAYLTVSEIFPMETRALAIAFFYAVGTAVGGISGPLLFGQLIESGERGQVIVAFLIGAGVMAIGGIAELLFGVKAEGAELEDIAKPLTAEEAEEGEGEGEEGEGEGEEGEGEAEEGEGEAEEGEAPEEEHPQRREAARLHAEAQDARARAAEHRAAVHELQPRVEGGDRRAEDRRGAEEVLAESDELRARCFDEQAAAAEHRAEADEAGEDEEAREAAEASVAAAVERARSWSERAEALTAEDEAGERRHGELSEAAGERARAREQRAAAAEARGEAEGAQGEEAAIASARAEMHEAWAEMHDLRGRVHERRAEGDEAGVAEREAEAAEKEELARAAEERLAAAERHGEAEEAREEAAEKEESAEERERAAERRRRDDERRRRIAARAARRRERSHAGLSRFRPGPGSFAASPGLSLTGGTGPPDEEALDREIEAISHALDEHGATRRDELARMVGARYWGPGRFPAAVREAVAEGRARRLSRTTLGPPEDDGGDNDGNGDGN